MTAGGAPQCPRLAREEFSGHSPRCPPLPREQCTGQNRPNVLLSREEFSGQNSRPHSPDLVRHMECCDRDGSELSHMALPNSASGTLVVDKPGREATRWPPAPSHEHAASATRLAPLVNGALRQNTILDRPRRFPLAREKAKAFSAAARWP
jgi:hypothetical protein